MMFTLVPTAWALSEEENRTPAPMATSENGEGAEESGSVAPKMSGNCSAVGSEASVKWALTKNNEDSSNPTYTLTISGEGKMANLNNSTETENISDGAGTYPWANLKDSITKIVIDDGVTSIGSKAFIAYTNVTSVNIGKDVSEIGVGALSQLSACTTFDVSSENSNFTTDPTGALFDHSQTKLIAFPCGSSATTYEIPDTVTTISYGAFSRAASLKTITIPKSSSLSTIGYGAFAFTTALETVNVIPASAATIGDIPFAQSGVKYIYCANADTRDRIQGKVNGLLVDVLLPDETPAIEFTTDSGYTYRIDDGKALLVSAPKNEETSTVPSKVTYQGTNYPVTRIWKGAFAISLDWREANSSPNKRNETITSVVLPDSVTQIGERAFYFCKKLTTITVESTEVSIDYLAFATQNPSGTTVDFSAVTTLQSNGTDKWVGVKTVILNNEAQLDTIKSNVNTGAVAVIGNNKWVMGSDGNWAEQPKTNLIAKVDDITWTFDAVGGKATLTAYSSKEATSVTVPATLTAEDGVTYTVTELGRGLFGWDGDWDADDHYNTSIKSVVIPKTVTTIGADMFRYSKNLESVKIQGESITFKSNRTFSNTNSLKVLDMSAVKAITFDSDKDTNSDKDTSYFSNMGSNNKSPAVIYVSSSAIMSAVGAHRSSGYLTYAVTNGGTFEENPTSNTELAMPVKAGYTFAGWYESADFSENAVTTPTANKVYYAKWTMADSISLTADKFSVTYESPITLRVTPANSKWSYAWYKDTDKNGELEFDQDTLIPNNGSNRSMLTLENVSDSGTYWVVVNDGSSTKTSNPVSVTIGKANGTASVSLKGWTYGETAKEPVLTSATNGINNVTYQYKVKGADDTTYSDTLPINAGDYTVKATFAATDNYNEVTATADFTITKATYNMTGVKFEDASYTYDGSEKTLTISGTLPTGVTVAYENNKLTNAGSVTATAKFTIADSDNYCAIDAMTATLTITKAKPTVSISAKPDSLRGGGKVTLTVTGVPEEGKVIVTCDNGITVDNANGTYSAVLPNRTVDYTFTLNYTGVENGNYSDATDTCTVSVTRRHTSSVTPGNTVSVPSTPNGTVTVNPSTASKGETVTITTKPSEGYELGSIEVLDKNGDSLKLKDLGNGKYSFVMPDGKVSVEAEFVKTAATSFADVPANAYFADAVKWAVDKGITNGLSDTTFGPYEPCTRAQIVTFLWRAAGSPEPKTAVSFADVPAGSYYAKAVAWAIENGITNGMTETTFAPDATCTRGQSVTFLHRALKDTASGSTNFTDVKSDAFYADSVNWAVASDVTNGTSNTTFSPNADCTRAEIVTFLYRAYQGK